MVKAFYGLARSCSSKSLFANKLQSKQVVCSLSMITARRTLFGGLSQCSEWPTLFRSISSERKCEIQSANYGKTLSRNVSMSANTKEELALMLGWDQHKHARVDISLIDFSEMKRIYADSVASLRELGNDSAAHAQAFARERLVALGMTLDTQASPSMGILFLCGHNAGRSQMAAAMLSHRLEGLLNEGRIDCLPAVSFSGGSIPSNEVNPICVQAMGEIGIDLSHAFPKPWTKEVASASKLIITMGCGDKCPVLPGQVCVNWDLPDPHGQGIDMVRQVRSAIAKNIDKLIENDLKISM